MHRGPEAGGEILADYEGRSPLTLHLPSVLYIYIWQLRQKLQDFYADH